MCIVFSPGRAKKQYTIKIKYYAAVRPELVEGQAKALSAKVLYSLKARRIGRTTKRPRRLPGALGRQGYLLDEKISRAVELVVQKEINLILAHRPVLRASEGKVQHAAARLE